MRLSRTLLVGILATREVHSFAGMLVRAKCRPRLFMEAPNDKTQEMDSQEVDSRDDSTASVNGASALVSMGDDERSRLASAFLNLGEADQYDAVLTGLCAKILDDDGIREEQALPLLQDPISLLKEMNDRNVQASGRSLMALIDVCYV